MIALKGIYHNGKLTLDKPIASQKPLEVIVTFLAEDVETGQKRRLTKSDFSFQESRKVMSSFGGSLSDAVIEERREDL